MIGDRVPRSTGGDGWLQWQQTDTDLVKWFLQEFLDAPELPAMDGFEPP
jgi:hypothetical protein